MALILEVAQRLFAERGYHETTLRAVAAEAGVTDAGVMHYFPTKAHLLAGVAGVKGEASGRAWAQLADPPFHVILAMMWTSTARAQSDPVNVDISVAAAAEGSNPSSPTHRQYAEQIAMAIGNISEMFRKCADRGEIRPDADPQVLARACLALGNGLNSQWVLAGRTFDMSEYLLLSLAHLGASVVHGADVDATVARIREAAATLGSVPPA